MRTETLKKAKVTAVEKFLCEQLSYEEWELRGVGILRTKMAKNYIVYVAVRENETIHEFYSRKAELRNDDITLRTFIPPQFFVHYSAISEICKDKRMLDPTLKTQICFGLKDIEVLTKKKGEEDSFKCVELKDFLGETQIPKFDAAIKWREHPDKPPRRRLVSPSRNVGPPRNVIPSRNGSSSKNVSTGSLPTGGQDMSLSSNENIQPLRRQRSNDGNNDEGKRVKTTALIEVEDDGSFTPSNGKVYLSDIL